MAADGSTPGAATSMLKEEDVVARPGCVPPCWDESDNGIPDLCLEHEYCPFHPHNPYTNDNCVCHVFGNLGLTHCDRHRRYFMGFAMLSTLSAMFITAYGALSLSSNPSVVRMAYWVRMEARWDAVSINGSKIRGSANPAALDLGGGNATTDLAYFGDGARAFLGLCAIVTVHDGEMTRDNWDHNYMLGVIERKGQESPVQRLQDDVLDGCRASMEGIQIGALLGCVTLVFGLVGTINRMRFSADANVQKGLGLVTDTWGALALSYAVLQFVHECYWVLPREHRDGPVKYDLDYALGPAFFCYVFCALSGIVRAVAHWLTPTPGNGSGTCIVGLPEYLLVGTRYDVSCASDGDCDAEAPPVARDQPRPGAATPPKRHLSRPISFNAYRAPAKFETPAAYALSWSEARAICRERRASIHHTFNPHYETDFLPSQGAYGAPSNTPDRQKSAPTLGSSRSFDDAPPPSPPRRADSAPERGLELSDILIERPPRQPLEHEA